MKGNSVLLVFLAVLACISGYLMSKVSWVGKVGMTFFYKEYNLLKVWWQGAIAVYLLFLGMFFLHRYIFNRLTLAISRTLFIVILFFAVAGFYFTYDDFAHDLSHKLLGRRFHLGFYLIWCGFAFISFFFFLKKKRMVVITDVPAATGL